MPDYIKNPTVVGFEELPKEKRWAACLHALDTDYTLPFRKACKILKCSRDWVSSYIKPNCHYIYLSRIGINYHSYAQEILGFEEMDSVWFNEKEFVKLIKSNIKSCTRQTILVPVEALINPDQMERFRIEYQAVCALMDRFISKEKREVVKRYATAEGLALWDMQASPYKRSNAKAVQVPLPSFDLKDMMAVHDLKDYGETDEMIYRGLFRKGSIKLEVAIPDKNGCVSKKIYYLFPNDDINLNNTVQAVLMKYSDYLLYKDRMNLSIL